MKVELRKNVMYCTGLIFIFCMLTSCFSKNNQLTDSAISSSNIYTDKANMNKYFQLIAKADCKIYIDSMDNIRLTNTQQNTSSYDVKSLKKYINNNVKSRNVMYIFYSKDAQVKYLSNDKEEVEVCEFWKNYFAKLGFKRLIIRGATSFACVHIIMDDNL